MRPSSGHFARFATLYALAAICAPPARGSALPPDMPGPRGENVRPVAIVSVTGDVKNPRHLIDGSGAPTGLVWRPGAPRPSLVLDYGVDVEGVPYADVTSARDNPTLHFAYSEDRRFADVFGDNGGNGPFMAQGIATRRADDLVITAPGNYAPKLPQGAARYEVITLSAPGEVTLADAGIMFNAFKPEGMLGSFQCSDPILTKIWYAGAYTLQLDMIPPHAQTLNAAPMIVDGAKRDRAVWSGDLQVEVPTALAAFGVDAAPYARASLTALFAGQDAAGGIPGIHTAGGNSFVYSAPYSLRAIIAAADYFDATGDIEFAKAIKPNVEKAFAYFAGHTHENGLLVTVATAMFAPGDDGGLDWNPFDGPIIGISTAYNALYAQALAAAAAIEAADGDAPKAASFAGDAARVRQAVNRLLFDPARGVYDLSAQDHQTIAEDANAEAIEAGIPDAARTQTVLNTLKSALWTPFGAEPFAHSAARSTVISPFVNGEETAARFLAGDDTNAASLMRHLWAQMVRPGPSYTGALWEKAAPGGGDLAYNGTDPINNNSLAHGWSTGPTWQLTRYILGASPATPGYTQWRVAPHVAGLSWAKGTVPTPHGPLHIEWRHDAQSHALTLDVAPPPNTTGTVEIPAGAGPFTVRINGQKLASGVASAGTVILPVRLPAEPDLGR